MEEARIHSSWGRTLQYPLSKSMCKQFHGSQVRYACNHTSRLLWPGPTYTPMVQNLLASSLSPGRNLRTRSLPGSWTAFGTTWLAGLSLSGIRSLSLGLGFRLGCALGSRSGILLLVLLGIPRDHGERCVKVDGQLCTVQVQALAIDYIVYTYIHFTATHGITLWRIFALKVQSKFLI